MAKHYFPVPTLDPTIKCTYYRNRSDNHCARGLLNYGSKFVRLVSCPTNSLDKAAFEWVQPDIDLTFFKLKFKQNYKNFGLRSSVWQNWLTRRTILSLNKIWLLFNDRRLLHQIDKFLYNRRETHILWYSWFCLFLHHFHTVGFVHKLARIP